MCSIKAVSWLWLAACNHIYSESHKQRAEEKDMENVQHALERSMGTFKAVDKCQQNSPGC